MVLSKNIIGPEQCYPDPLLSNSSSFPRIIFHLETEDREKIEKNSNFQTSF